MGAHVTLLPYFAPREPWWGQPVLGFSGMHGGGRREQRLMSFRIVLAPVRPVRRALALIGTTAALAMVAATASVAQQPLQTTPAPAPAPKKAAPKQAPKQPPAQTQTAPAQQPAPPADQQAAAPPEQPQMPIVYSPWTKFCGKDNNNPQSKEVCLTVKEARLETGQFVAGAALIEQEGEQRKILRVTLPLGMQLNPGTRMIVDKEQPLSGRYVVCLPNGCMADFEVNADFVGKLKKGQTILLQGINLPGQAASYPLPLVEFAKANEGPPTDPKVFEEQQKKLQAELQKRADEERKRLQDRQNNPTPAPQSQITPPQR
jgi:invasion protein IalB